MHDHAFMACPVCRLSIPLIAGKPPASAWFGGLLSCCRPLASGGDGWRAYALISALNCGRLMANWQDVQPSQQLWAPMQTLLAPVSVCSCADGPCPCVCGLLCRRCSPLCLWAPVQVVHALVSVCPAHGPCPCICVPLCRRCSPLCLCAPVQMVHAPVSVCSCADGPCPWCSKQAFHC